MGIYNSTKMAFWILSSIVKSRFLQFSMCGTHYYDNICVFLSSILLTDLAIAFLLCILFLNSIITLILYCCEKKTRINLSKLLLLLLYTVALVTEYEIVMPHLSQVLWNQNEESHHLKIKYHNIFILKITND